MSWFSQPIRENKPICEVIIANDDTNEQIYFKALIDTGATSTCISKKVFERLALKKIGMTTMHSASIKNETVDTTFINLKIPITKNEIHELKVQNVLILSALDNYKMDVIIGMDIIQKGIFIMQGGMYTLIF